MKKHVFQKLELLKCRVRRCSGGVRNLPFLSQEACCILQRPGLIVTLADKGGHLVIMSRGDHRRLHADMLSDSERYLLFGESYSEYRSLCSGICSVDPKFSKFKLVRSFGNCDFKPIT